MKYFEVKIRKLRFEWNKKPLTENDFFRLCKKLKISVTLMPLEVEGFYYAVKGRHYIAIDSNLRGLRRVFTMFHELGHFLMHAPETGVTANFSGLVKDTVLEREADAFALCALLPLHLVQTRTIQELVEDESFPSGFVKDRMGVYQRYGF